MAETSQFYCRKCGAKLPLSGVAVQKHYEKAHFSEWTQNKELMGRMPKAFLVGEAKMVQTPTNVAKAVAEKAAAKKAMHVPDTPLSVQNREANKDAIMERLKSCVDKLPYKGEELYECPCCLRKVRLGMNIICKRERFTLCPDCYNETRLAIPHKTRPISF